MLCDLRDLLRIRLGGENYRLEEGTDEKHRLIWMCVFHHQERPPEQEHQISGDSTHRIIVMGGSCIYIFCSGQYFVQSRNYFLSINEEE